MTYCLKLHKRFLEHVEIHKRAGNKILIKKIETLITEIKEHPRTGTGKPEQLKHGTFVKRKNKSNYFIAR